MQRLSGPVRGVLFVLVVGCGLGVPSVAQGATDPVITVRYTGSLDTSSEPIMKLPDGRNVQRASYRWTLVWRGRLSTLAKSATQAFTVETLSGTVSYVDRTSAEHADCTGEYVPRTKKITFTASYTAGGSSIGFNVRVPVSTEFLVPTNTTSLHEFCSEVQRWAVPGSDLVPFFEVSAKGGTASHNVRIPPQGANRDRGDLTQRLAVSIAGTSPSGGVDPKRVAREDLRRALERAKGPCLQLGISLGVITTGAVWTAVAAPVPGGIPAGAAVIATGDVMASAIAPICAELVRQIVVDYTIIKRDPPLPRGLTQSRPSCTRWQGKVRAYCEELRTSVTGLVVAERRVVAALVQLQGAAGTLAAARRKGNAAAIEAAQRRVSAAASSLKSARSAASVAGRQVAGVVRAAGVRGRLTRAQSTATTNALLAELAKRGVPSSELRALAPSAFAPRAVDVLATLSY